MDEISQKEFDKAAALNPEKLKDETKELTETEFKSLLEEMQNPVQAQQKLAVQIKIFLDKKIKAEMSDKGSLTDHTRRWLDLTIMYKLSFVFQGLPTLATLLLKLYPKS